MRVPGIAWWPNKIRHGRTHQLASTLDLLPTIFSMAGADLPKDTKMDGTDLSSLLYNKNGKVYAVYCIVVSMFSLTARFQWTAIV